MHEPESSPRLMLFLIMLIAFAGFLFIYFVPTQTSGIVPPTGSITPEVSAPEAPTITLVDKPQDSRLPQNAHEQFPIAKDNAFKNIPFVETAPEPELSDQELHCGFMLFRRAITDIVYPGTHPRPHERIQYLDGFATPGEFEPLTFSIYPIRNLTNMRVMVSSLESDESRIRSKSIDVRLLTYWNVRFPHYTSTSYRRVPELLEKVTAHSCPTKECQRWWLTVRVPDDAQPGIYRGTVTIWDDLCDKAIRLPIRFRVLGFKLLNDPNKRYTAYNYDLHREIDDRVKPGYRSKRAKEKGDAWILRAAKTEYCSMREFGFTTSPTLYLRYDSKTDELYIPRADKAIRAILATGMRGPIPVVGCAIGHFYRKYTQKKMGRHCRIPEEPPTALYEELTRLVRKLEVVRKQKHWPEFIYVPIDEVAAESKNFGINVYKAFKAAGVRTYATKNPVSIDAADYAPYVDFWCSQPFSIPYEKATTDQKHGYWSYPNHNSNETRIPRVMCKGGRMTYGYGFWRSGYTLLIPWIWRWEIDQRFDYLDGSVSDSSNQIDESAETIPAVYWSCFREGIDDLRYIYTLQTAIMQRQGSADPACRQILQQANQLLQTIWRSIAVQQKYKYTGLWPSNMFQTFRWQIACAVRMLQVFPATNNDTAPSVLAATANQSADRDRQSISAIFNEQLAKGNLTLKDLGDETFALWKNVTKEGTTSVIDTMAHKGKKCLHYQVKIDHKVDGGDGEGKYTLGWPRICADLQPAMDFTQFDYFTLWIRVDSDRDEVADDFTPLNLDIITPVRKHLRSDIINEVDQRVWIPVVVPLDEMIDPQEGKEEWQNVKTLQIWLGESQYRHGETIHFYIDEIALAALKQPILARVDAPSVVLLPATALEISCRILGKGRRVKGEFLLRSELQDSNQQAVSTFMQDLLVDDRIFLSVGALQPGTYTLTTSIIDQHNTTISAKTTTLHAVTGPTFGQ